MNKMKNKIMSEARFTGLKDEQDTKGANKKILKSFNQANPDSDNCIYLNSILELI